MAAISELSKDDTLFCGLLNDARLDFQSFENKNTKARKSDRLKVDSGEKENSNSKKAGKEGDGRQSKKAAREPLKVVNGQRKTSPSVKVDPSPCRKRATKENPSTPKIRIYEDAPRRLRPRPENAEEKTGRKRSKSLDSSKPIAARKNLPEAARRSMRSLASPTSGKGRYSLRSVTPTKSPGGRKSGSKSLSSAEKSVKIRAEEAFARAEMVFPNVDPEYLKSQCLRLKGSLPEVIDLMISKEKKGELPTRADFVNRQEVERRQREFLENFSVENFLQAIPDPWDYFVHRKRPERVNYAEHSLHYLKNKFKKHYSQSIQEAFLKNQHSLYLTDKELGKKSKNVKMRATNRSKGECDAGKPTTFDPQFMHEVAFIENEAKIKRHLKKAEKAKNQKLTRAQKAGTLLECQSCYDPTLLWDDAVNCPANHVFCRDCVVQYVESEVEKKNFHFKCPVKCEEKFPIKTLQEILSPLAMTEIMKKIQNEIKSAEMENLVVCLNCNYVAGVSPEVAVFRCPNPACMVESCRYCGQLNHVPLKCNELEKFDETIMENEVQDTSSRFSLRKGRESVETISSLGTTSGSDGIKAEPSSGRFHEELSEDSETDEAVEKADGKDLEGTAESKYFDSSENISDFNSMDSTS